MNISFLSTARIAAFLRSQAFFRAIIGLFILQAAWIALSGRYPMAFDEDFHLGVIKLYAEHWSPFWSAHPAGGDAFGALTRDPSYLYHYLMSFPYRFITLFTDNQTLQVLILRGMNIAFFACGLPLYRRLLLKTGASKSLVHLSLLIFVLIPIVPLLGAQINYDNVIIPLTALTLLLAIQVSESLHKQSIDLTRLLQFVAVSLFASLIKYAYLPIFVGAAGYLLFRAWRVYRTPRRLTKALNKSWPLLRGWSHWGLIALVVLMGVLFAERYGVNLVRYHTPVPDCAQALTYNECQHYGPWIRDYNFEMSKPADSDRDPIHYTQHWLYGMWLRSFFAVDGPASDFQTRSPLLIPGMTGAILAITGLGALLVSARRVWRRYNGSVLWLFSIATLLYVAILWVTQYQLYLQTAQPVAINGRYLLPVLPLAVTMTALAVRELLGHRERLQLLIATVVVICLMWGGGALTYILRSNDAWYWPGTPFKAANHALQQTLGPITPGYDHPTEFLPH
ncbi:MAG: hypothetical protein JWO35_728 [Candidatus Saccharibacteria bacterium]|nr:hypothetical protein [Candidatus Saccharibacteria bacterium]